MKEISQNQITDASGGLFDVAKSVGANFERPNDMLGGPSFEEAAYALGKYEDIPAGSFTVHGNEIAAKRLQIGRLIGLRVLAGVVDAQRRAAFLPAVVIADSVGHRLGCLSAPQDVRPANESMRHLVQPFTSTQQILLGKILAQHQPTAGSHGIAEINAAEINHASLIAASETPVNIHRAVHQLVDGGQFSSSLARNGATNIKLKSKIRTNEEVLLSFDQVAGLLICKSQQVPFPLGGNAFDLSAGFTLAARRTQGGGQPGLLRANTAGIYE